jgi:hypothetical protein
MKKLALAALAVITLSIGSMQIAAAWSSCTTNCYGNTCTRTCY